MTNFTPEQVLGLQDPEIVKQIQENDEFAEYLSGLIVEVYQDDTLADVRGALMEEAIKNSGVDCEWEKDWTEDDRQQHREKTYPLAFDPKQVVDIRVKVLAKVRCAVKRAYPSVSDLMFLPGKEGLQDILKKTKDGDLTYRYSSEDRDGENYLAGERSMGALFKWGLKFSPELQLKMAKEAENDIRGNKGINHAADVAGVLSQKGELSAEAWKILLGKDDTNTYFAVWNTRETRPEILEMIMGIEKLALLYRARTEPKARAEIINRASEFPSINIVSWVERKDKKMDHEED
ncbi:hypothetical protein M0P48_04580 [Candidatus Gracilibacteria bacterium]|jgi:hypothetical protein|nr:hypothetical protein [Candidatus Gracilibacteria bacterium]